MATVTTNWWRETLTLVETCLSIKLALFGVWTIHFWSHYHRLTSDCRRNELRPSSNWEKKRRNKIWIRPRHFSVDFNFYIAAQQFFFSFFRLGSFFFVVGYREVQRMRRTEDRGWKMKAPFLSFLFFVFVVARGLRNFYFTKTIFLLD